MKFFQTLVAKWNESTLQEKKKKTYKQNFLLKNFWNFWKKVSHEHFSVLPQKKKKKKKTVSDIFFLQKFLKFSNKRVEVSNTTIGQEKKKKKVFLFFSQNF